MKDIAISDIRNFVLLGHTQSGKTTLADTLIYKLGISEEMGSVANGTSIGDYTQEEKERQISIYAKSFCGLYKTAEKKKRQIVFIDTPGYDDFIGQVICGCRAADSGLIVVDASSGIQIGTRRSWTYCSTLEMPCAIVITGLDRENADFSKCLLSIQNTFGKICLPVIVPQSSSNSVISLIHKDNKQLSSLPQDLLAYKESLIEKATESNDTLIEKYLGGQPLTTEEVFTGLRAAMLKRSFIPVFPAIPTKDIGIAELLEAIVSFFPAPDEIELKTIDGNTIDVSTNTKFVGQIWRTMTDPYAGKVAFIRVFSGVLKQETEVVNVTKGEKERIGALLLLNGNKKPTPISEASAGDIVALAKLKTARLGDVLSTDRKPVGFKPFDFPGPVTSFAIVAKKQGEEDKVATALSRVVEDDPTLHLERHTDTNELVISGLGDTQIEVANSLIKKRSNVEVELKTPKVSYRETVTAQGNGRYKHKKQSGGRGQYAEVYARIQPKKQGEDWFEDAIVGGAIPRNFILSCEKGLADAIAHGVIAGFPVVDVKITVYDGTFHEVDSSDIAFKIAASRAFKDAMNNAKPVLLEPIMKVKVTVPDRFMGDINSDLNQRRGRILGVDVINGMQVITAEVPLVEMFRYSSELRSMTAGSGTFEMSHSRYEIVPSHIAEKVKADAVQEKEEK